MIWGIEIGSTFFSGHHLDSGFNRVVNFGKLGDAHHSQNFLVMVRNSCNSDFLVILIRLGQDLDQHRNSPAVDIGIGADPNNSNQSLP